MAIDIACGFINLAGNSKVSLMIRVINTAPYIMRDIDLPIHFEWKRKIDCSSKAVREIHERVIKNADVSSSLLNVVFFNNGVFISGVQGEIDGKLIKERMSSSIVVINSPSPLSVTDSDGRVLNYQPGVLCYKAAKKIEIKVNCKVFILRDCIFHGIFSLELPDGEIKIKHDGLIASIFDSIGVDKKNLVNESFAIANILAMSIGDTRGTCLINQALDKLYANPSFNLDRLAKEVCMSRRKVQYILSEKGTSFSDEVKRRRVSKMKSLINSSNRKAPMTYYANMVGFKNLNSATKSFMDISGVSMKEYIYNARAQCKRVDAFNPYKPDKL